MVYDYVLGKVDWMAAGLPVEGERGPYVGEALVEIATCAPDDVAAEVEAPAAVVVGERVAIGFFSEEAQRDAPDGATVLDVMEVVPDTLRPSVLVEDLDSRVAYRLVTAPEGRLLGAVDPAALPPHQHQHEHGH